MCEDFKTIKSEVVHTVEIDIDEEMIEKLVEQARSLIVNDRKALIDYGVNQALRMVY